MSDTYARPTCTTRKGFRLGLGAAFIIVSVTIARAIWVSLYAVDIPFWDQWPQIIMQMVPLKQGTWHYSDYWAPHNEHRILFTRLISMTLFELDGGIWSNLIEAYANTVIYGATLAFFYVVACRGADRLFKWVMLLAVTALGILPYDWENNLVGFQNQFYIIVAFAVALAGIASYRRATSSTTWILVALAVASLFTMASGLFGTVAVCAVIALRAWREQLPSTYVVATLGAMILVAICGLLLLPASPGNDIYKAHGITDHIHAFVVVMIWPMQSIDSKHALRALLIWTPTAIWLFKFLRTRTAQNSEILLIGLIAWVVCQAVAIAHSRGHDISSIPPRYSNITTIGLLANFALALHLMRAEQLRTTAKYLSWTAVILGVGAIAVIFMKRIPDDMDAMQQRYDFGRMETYYTHAYLSTGNPSFLQHPSLTIPFPSAQQLQIFLDSPVIQSLLPPTLERTSLFPAEGAMHAGWLALTALDVQRAIRLYLTEVGVNTPSIFFQPLPSDSHIGLGTSPIGMCSDNDVDDAEVTTGPLRAKSGDPIRFYGWIINPESSSAKRFFIVLAGKERFALEVKPGVNRKDVVRIQHSNPQDTYGFRAYGILLNVPPDDYSIRLTTLGNNGKLICELPYKLVISQ
jgi:hypothetical protein